MHQRSQPSTSEESSHVSDTGSESKGSPADTAEPHDSLRQRDNHAPLVAFREQASQQMYAQPSLSNREQASSVRRRTLRSGMY